jgi:hypothetical protein
MRTKWLLAVTAVGVLLVSGYPVRADWNSGQYAKWVQLPDLTPNGIDIDTDGCAYVADDFLCRQQGLVTDVHFWGSWLGDVKAPIISITLKFYSDDPVGPGGDPNNTFSKPDGLLKTVTVGPQGHVGFDGYFKESSTFTEVKPGEWFWKPGQGSPQQNGDTQVWQYNIYIDPAKAFEQEGTAAAPKIYWLEVEMNLGGTADFGWKTRDIQDGHSYDDAVYRSLSADWTPLEYPQGHPYGNGAAPVSIDMAFVITPEPATLALLIAGGGLMALRRRRR